MTMKLYLPLKGKFGWIMMFTGFASVITFLIVNAAFYYNGGYNSYTYTSYQQGQLDTAIFADVKQTPLITNITNVTQDRDSINMKFIAENTNQTLKVLEFQCSIDGMKWFSCSSPVNLNTTKYVDEEHTFEIRVIDSNKGVEQTPAVVFFKQR